jgi:hypothetical protein
MNPPIAASATIGVIAAAAIKPALFVFSFVPCQPECQLYPSALVEAFEEGELSKVPAVKDEIAMSEVGERSGREVAWVVVTQVREVVGLVGLVQNPSSSSSVIQCGRGECGGYLGKSVSIMTTDVPVAGVIMIVEAIFPTKRFGEGGRKSG